MPKDVLITPASGLIDFKDTGGASDATIQLDDSGNLNITNAGGVLSIGNTAANLYIGDGTNSVDIIFEQNGKIRALTNKTLTLGQSDSYVNIAAPTLFVSPDGTKSITARMLNTDVLSFQGGAGELLSLSDSMSGTIYSVNDVSGVPSIEVLDTGLIKLGQYSGNVLLGTGTDNATDKLQVNGSILATTVKSNLTGYKNVDNSNEITIANGFAGGGPLYLNYRGSTTATTMLRICDGMAGGGQIPVEAKTFSSTVATGTAPLTVTSTTVVTNLNADMLDGLHLNTSGRADVANQIVRTDANGYIQAGWINTTSGDNGTTAITRIYASSDAYIRYYTPANFKTLLGISSGGVSVGRVYFTRG